MTERSSWKFTAGAAAVAIAALVALLVAGSLLALSYLWPKENAAEPQAMSAKTTAERLASKNVAVPPGMNFVAGTFYPVAFSGAPSFDATFSTNRPVADVVADVDNLNPTFPALAINTCEAPDQQELLVSVGLPCPGEAVAYSTLRADPGTAPAREVRRGWDSQGLIVLQRGDVVEFRVVSSGH